MGLKYENIPPLFDRPHSADEALKLLDALMDRGVLVQSLTCGTVTIEFAVPPGVERDDETVAGVSSSTNHTREGFLAAFAKVNPPPGSEAIDDE